MTNPTNQAEVEGQDEPGLDNAAKNVDNRGKAKTFSRDDMYSRHEAYRVATEAGELDAPADVGNPIVESEAEIEATEVLPPTKQAVKTAQAPVIDGTLRNFIAIGDDGVPLFRAKVNGQDRLIPLDKAQQQLQKHEAADVRLQQAADATRQSQERLAEVQRREAALTQRPAQVPLSVTSDVDDKAVEQEAANLSKVLLNGTPDEITTALTGVLKRTRQAPAPAIDRKALVNEAVVTVKQELAVDGHNKSLAKGYSEATSAYPEIFADPNLYTFADNLSTKIAKDSPELTPDQVIMEAGKRTRAWVASLKGEKPAATVDTTVVSESRRVANKQQLRPVPPARIARAPAAEAAQQETPQSILAEMKAARGQAA